MSQSNQPSYYAVIFCSQRTDADDAGYAAASERMRVLASQQSGFLGMESVRDDGGFGITVSYWRDLDAVAAWKRQVEHLGAQRLGREKWYESYRLQVAKVERAFEFPPKR